MPKLLKRFVKAIFSESTIIPWMLVVALIPMVLVTYIAYDIAKKSLLSSIEHTLAAAIQKKVEIIDDYISQRKLYLLQISTLPTLSDIIEAAEHRGHLDLIDKTAMAPLANYLNHFSSKLGISNIYIISNQGKVVYSLNHDPLLGVSLASSNPDENELYQSFKGAEILLMPYLASSYTEIGNGELHLYISNAILDDNGLIKAVLIMELDPREITHVIKRYLGYSNTEGAIIAAMADNQPVIALDTSQDTFDIASIKKNAALMSLLKRAVLGESGHPQEIMQDGKAFLVIYRYIPQLNMGLLIHYEKAEIFRRLYWLQFNMWILISIGLLLVAGLVYWISHQLWQANIKSEQLLHNIFPNFVIEELKEKKSFVARNVQNTSILFVDIVNFTQFASSTAPAAVVKFLDDIFSVFDKVTSKYQLEKIKTIGDAYMAAAGLTMAQANHANLAVNAGLDMISAIKHYNIDHHSNFKLRIGIDSGTVTTGIIGEQKLSYDLWGHAVNRASRMELTGIENNIQITAETYAVLSNKDHYNITPRKGVIVKGLGEMDTYLITNYAFGD